MPTSVCLLQTENRNDELPFAFCKQNRKTKVCFPWSANNKQFLIIAISANVPIYGGISGEREQFT
jgi:hypothetical protein